MSSTSSGLQSSLKPSLELRKSQSCSDVQIFDDSNFEDNGDEDNPDDDDDGWGNFGSVSPTPPSEVPVLNHYNHPARMVTERASR